MKPLDRDQLKKAVSELAFETYHFRCYRTLKDDPKLRAFSPAASQAVGYTLLIHLRVLLDFFFAEPMKDDCHIAHFKALQDFVFPDSLCVRSNEIGEVIDALNKRLAHMTATRWEKPGQSWDFYNKYASTILGLIASFESALPEDLADSYKKGYQKWIGHKGHI